MGNEPAEHLGGGVGVGVVQGEEVAREAPVVGLIGLVQDEVDEVKAGDEGGRQVQVVHDGQARVVARAHRVGGRQHARARVERCDNARLGHRHCLLLHHLVQLRAQHTRSAGSNHQHCCSTLQQRMLALQY